VDSETLVSLRDLAAQRDVPFTLDEYMKGETA
jgi:hypothetical protein